MCCSFFSKKLIQFIEGMSKISHEIDISEALVRLLLINSPLSSNVMSNLDCYLVSWSYASTALSISSFNFFIAVI